MICASVDVHAPTTEGCFEEHQKNDKEILEAFELTKDHESYTSKHDEFNHPDDQELAQVESHLLQHLEHWTKLLRHSQLQQQLKPSVQRRDGQQIFKWISGLHLKPDDVA